MNDRVVVGLLWLGCLGCKSEAPPIAVVYENAAPAAQATPVELSLVERKARKREEPGVQMVTIDGGYQVFTQRVGTGPMTLLLLNGGPGVSHEYFRNFTDHLPPAGVQIIYYDQLGSFYSDQPDDPKLWTIDRFVAEVETVRAALGLEQFYVLGNSWGGLLLMEYALVHPDHLKGIIISNMVADMNDYEAYIAGLRAVLPAETQAAMKAFEDAKDLENPEYQNLIFTNLYTKHLCRLDPWPEPLILALQTLGTSVYHAMNGHTEFFIDGSLKGWSRKADLPRLKQPALLLVGAHDTMSPKAMEEMSTLIPNSRFHVCPNGSHITWYDDETCYFEHLLSFLRDVESGKFVGGKG